MNKEEQSRRGEDVIAGRNAVTEALRSGSRSTACM